MSTCRSRSCTSPTPWPGAGCRRRLLGSTWEAQTFFGRRWRTQVFLFDDNEKDYQATSITSRVGNISFQQTRRWRSGLTGRRWHDRLRVLWGYAYRRIDYIDPTTGATLGGNRAGLTTSMIGDTRDSATDPHDGFFWTVSADPALEALGSDASYWKLYGQLFAYVPLGRKVVWAQALRVGAAPGDDPLLLLDRRFQAGGATTVRGFAENSLGPRYQDIWVGGQGLFVFNQELRFPIWDRVQAGVFFDAGNVWALAGELDPGDLRSNVGAGLRVMFPFGPIRLDWAWVLDPREGEQRSRWQFALGHAF